MKQFMTELCSKVKQLLSPEKLKSVKEFILTKIYNPAKEFCDSKVRPFVQERVPEKARKFLLPGLLLILALILALSIALSGGSAETPTAPVESLGRVAAETLDVHKKAKSGSQVLGQLPYDLDIEILEELTVKETTWGRIDATQLPDGSTVKGGWVDLQQVDFSPREVPEEEIPADDGQPAHQVPVTMGTVTAHKLNVRKGPGSEYEKVDAYYMYDRVEILETETVDDTVWGRTNLGWVGMGYVRMDGTAPAENADPSLTTDGNTEVLGYGVVTLRELNVRLGPGTQYFKVRSIAMGARHAYYQLQDGWVRIEDGWVSTEFFYLEGSLTDSAYTASVTSEDLNIRTGPNTSFNSIGKYKQGETIEILALVDKWAYTTNGWVFAAYVEPVKPTYTTGSGSVANGLNIRQEPSADSLIVDTYTTGDRVTVLEVNDGWGRTDKGWINLKYVIYDEAAPAPTAAETTP